MKEEIKKTIYVAGTYNMRFYSTFGSVMFDERKGNIKEEVFNNPQRLKDLIFLTHAITHPMSVDRPDVNEDDIKAKTYEINGVRIICLQLPEVHYECQSKFIAFAYSKDKDPIYYSAELVEKEDEFVLCFKNKEKTHFLTNILMIKDVTMDEFIPLVYDAYLRRNKCDA